MAAGFFYFSVLPGMIVLLVRNKLEVFELFAEMLFIHSQHTGPSSLDESSMLDLNPK